MQAKQINNEIQISIFKKKNKTIYNNNNNDNNNKHNNQPKFKNMNFNQEFQDPKDQPNQE